MSNNRTICIVEDHQFLRESISECLKDYSYKVIEASNGKEALEILKSQNVDIVFADLQMPVMDGYTFLERVKDLNIYIPVVILSGRNNAEDVIKAIRLGAADYICKPIFDIRSVKTIAEMHIERYRKIAEVSVQKIALEESSSRLENKITINSLELESAKKNLSKEVQIRKNIVSQLESINNKYLGMLENMPFGIALLDFDGIIKYSNFPFRKALKIKTNESFLEYKLVDFINPRELEKVEKVLEEIIKSSHSTKGITTQVTILGDNNKRVEIYLFKHNLMGDTDEICTVITGEILLS